MKDHPVAGEAPRRRSTPEHNLTRLREKRMSEQQQSEATNEAEGNEQEQTFKQADVDRIVADRLKREREATKAKYADYDDLKSKAEGARTAEERIAALEGEIETTKREAMRRRVQAAHGISDEDADLFLTGADEESLTAQAKRLSDREAERKQNNNLSPREGQNSSGNASEESQFAQNLFASAD